jgi:glutaredoxin 3
MVHPSTRPLALALVLLAVSAGQGCRKRTPPTPPPAAAKATPDTAVFSKGGALLYTYVDDKGGFATTDKAEDVPEGSRKLVRVVDPSKPAVQGGDATQVYALDLDELLRKGKVEARALSREAFETGAFAQLPPGESSPMAGPHGPALPEEPLPDAGSHGASPVVILYGTPWCGACKEAKRYLASKHIPYAYKNIESDEAAARELQAKAAKLGVPADRVPILDVRGRLLIGFDRDRLDAMLGEAS